MLNMEQQQSSQSHRTLDIGPLCANCCSSIDSCARKLQTNPHPLHSRQQESSTYPNKPCNTCDSADLNEMLSKIYNLDFIPRLLQKYPGASPGEDTTYVDNMNTITEVVHFPLCFVCTTLLKPLFSLYSQFNQIRAIESLLSIQIKALNSLINYDSQNQNQQGNHDPEGIPNSNSTIQDIVDPQITTKTTTTTSSSSSKFPFHSNDRGPCFSEEIDPLADIRYVESSYCTICREAAQGTSNSRNEMLNQPKIHQDNALDHEPSFSSHAGNNDGVNIVVYETFPYPDLETDEDSEPDVKPDSVDIKPDIELDSDSASESTKKESALSPLVTNRSPGNEEEEDTAASVDDSTNVGGKRAQGEENFACTVVNNEGHVCAYRTSCSRYLRNHMRRVHTNTNTKAKVRIKCDECTAVFNGKQSLKAHVLHSHAGKDKSGERKKIACPIASQRDGTSLSLSRSSCEKKSPCDPSQQEESQTRRENREYDARKRTGSVCPHCGIDFITVQKCTTHRRWVHDDYGTKTRIVVCELCGKKSLGRDRHRTHVQHVHSDERPFVCDLCERSYKSKGNLATHKTRYHSEEGRQKYNEYQLANLRKKRSAKELEARAEAEEMDAEVETSESDSKF